MTGRQNRDIDYEAVSMIRASAWRKPATDASTRSYDRAPPYTEPGYLVYLKRDDQVGQDAIIRSQINSEGLGHPLLILRKDEGGLFHCLPLTSFNDSGHLSARAKLRPQDYRFISHAPEQQAEQIRESRAGGTPLKLNSQPEKMCWVDQSRVLKVELQSLKVYVNGRHKIDEESLDKIVRYCKWLLPNTADKASPKAQPWSNHRRKDSGYGSDGAKSDPTKLDNWRSQS